MELSLRRLTRDARELVERLVVLCGGGHVVLVSQIIGIETAAAFSLAEQLVGTGLAQLMEYDYLRLDPALPSYLRLGMPEEGLARWEAVWADAMAELVGFLFGQFFKDSTMAARLTLLEMANLMALLDFLERRAGQDEAAETVAVIAGQIEHFLQYLGRPRALARAAEVRERATAKVPAWGKTRFENERLASGRLLQAGPLREAHAKATALLEKAEAHGPTAYDGADYDSAMAAYLLGDVLDRAGQASPALERLTQARRMFEELGKRGERMASAALNRQADCLEALGRLEEAVAFYRQAADIRSEQGDMRSEGFARASAADALRRLGRHDKARREVLRAIECIRPFGPSGQPWTAFGFLHDIEAETGNADAALGAWRQAWDAYLAYRRQGGYAKSGGGKLADLALQMIAAGKTEEVAPLFDKQATSPDLPDSLKRLIPAIRAILLAGTRDPSLADDPAFFYGDAAEVLFLLDRLGQ